MATLQRVAGGGFGLGGTLAARQFLDEPGNSRFTQPSALFGLGTGALALGLWYVDVDLLLGDDFWASHAITSIPSGLVSVLFPKKAGSPATERIRDQLFSGGNQRSRTPPASSGNGGSNGGGSNNGGANAQSVRATGSRRSRR